MAGEGVVQLRRLARYSTLTLSTCSQCDNLSLKGRAVVFKIFEKAFPVFAVGILLAESAEHAPCFIVAQRLKRARAGSFTAPSAILSRQVFIERSAGESGNLVSSFGDERFHT